MSEMNDLSTDAPRTSSASQQAALVGEISPGRRKRFFKHLLNNASRHRAKKDLLYRASFVKNIDKLRSIEQVEQLKASSSKGSSAANTSKTTSTDRRASSVEDKIDLLIQGQRRFDDERVFDRKLLSTISEREDQELDILKKVASEEQEEESNIRTLSEKIVELQERLGLLKKKAQGQGPESVTRIQHIEKRVRALQTQTPSMQTDESREEPRETSTPSRKKGTARKKSKSATKKKR